MVLRRLAGKTANTAPVMMLITQFGGGKTHTLTALYHLVTAGERVGRLDEVASLLHDEGQSLPPPLPSRRMVAVIAAYADPSRLNRLMGVIRKAA